MERFWSKVKKGSPNECWEWTAAKNNKGYGKFKFEGKMRKAHRISWQLHYGPVQNELHVLHTCDNPSCVNPNHLWLGSNSDNHKDMTDKDRISGRYGRKTYTIIFPNGLEEVVTNISLFCRTHGLDAGHLIKTAKGQYKQHKGFRARYL